MDTLNNRIAAMLLAALRAYDDGTGPWDVDERDVFAFWEQWVQDGRREAVERGYSE